MIARRIACRLTAQEEPPADYGWRKKPTVTIPRSDAPREVRTDVFKAHAAALGFSTEIVHWLTLPDRSIAVSFDSGNFVQDLDKVNIFFYLPKEYMATTTLERFLRMDPAKFQQLVAVIQEFNQLGIELKAKLQKLPVEAKRKIKEVLG